MIEAKEMIRDISSMCVTAGFARIRPPLNLAAIVKD